MFYSLFPDLIEIILHSDEGCGNVFRAPDL